MNGILQPSERIFYGLTHPVTPVCLCVFLLFCASMGLGIQPDEAIWNYIGWAWTEHGVAPYTGALENKTPGIFMIYALTQWVFGGMNLLGPRWLGIAAQALTCLLVYRLVERMQDRVAAAFSAFFFACATASPLVHGQAPGYTESFMSLFAVWSLLILFSDGPSESLPGKGPLFCAGVAMGVAIAFKQVAVFSALALWFLIWEQTRRASHPSGILLRSTFFVLTGILVSTVVSLVPLWASGVSTADYLKDAWMILLEPGGGGAELSMRLERGKDLLFTPQTLLVLIPFLFFGRRIALRKSFTRFHVWVAVWFFAEFLAINASGYYWGHQLKQLLPPLAVLIGLAAGPLLCVPGTPSRYTLRINGSLTLLILLCLPYGEIHGAYRRYQNPPEQSYEILGQWIQEYTEPEDFVLSYGPQAHMVFVHFRRLSSFRDFTWFFAERPGMEVEREIQLRQRTPRLILLQGDLQLPGKAGEFLKRYYDERFPQPDQRYGFRIFWKTTTVEPPP